jgi:hypothetical protein
VPVRGRATWRAPRDAVRVLRSAATGASAACAVTTQHTLGSEEYIAPFRDEGSVRGDRLRLSRAEEKRQRRNARRLREARR